MNTLDTELLRRARDWANADPDPDTAAELHAMLDAAWAVSTTGAETEFARQARAEITDAFSGRLEFGTAGLRARLGAGPRRMNRVVVRQTAAGLADFLQQQAKVSAAAYRPRIVVGYDARHNSAVFAAESAAVFTAAGLETFLMPAALPTPVLAFAVRALGCEGGVMVTASHNPPQDNGYKVYLGGRIFDPAREVEAAARGAQIVPPFDAEIAARIETAAARPVQDIALAEEGWQTVPEELVQAYQQGLVGMLRPQRYGSRELRIVTTALHGVGAHILESVLRAGGFEQLLPVTAQRTPDPTFPTVAFPNPEEPGALDLAVQAATETGADLVIANDPDADRVAVAVPPGNVTRAGNGQADGSWRMLSGDEVGVLLGAHLIDRQDAEPENTPSENTRSTLGVFASSIVSSRMLGKIAAAAGYQHVQTLTGFKWIARVPGLSYGYEEALGYCLAPSLVRDKDGISAALLIAELAASVKAAGSTLQQRLDELAVRHGLHRTSQLSIRVADLRLLGGIMAQLRDHAPQELAGSPIRRAEDLTRGLVVETGQLPPTEGLLYETEDSSRVIVRPSGTEPKLKCYLEVIVPVAELAELPAAEARAQESLGRLRDELAALIGVP